jgi:hypothetical protein
MKERQLRQVEWLLRIVIFLDGTVFTHPRVLHLKNEILAHYERVMELVAENSKVKIEPGRVRSRYVSKDTLRELQMLPLARRGRKLARVHPELAPALKVPHKNASVDEMAAAAERMADALTPYLHVFIQARFSRNCLTTLRRDAGALRAHADEVQQARTLLGRSNRELTEELSLARQTVDELDLVLRTLDDYPSFAPTWRSVNHISPRRGRPTKRRLAARERSAARRQAREDRGAPEAAV